eukprot:5923461-Amphidinium_carterae.1
MGKVDHQPWVKKEQATGIRTSFSHSVASPLMLTKNPAQHDVCGLEVTVNDSLGVHVLQRRDHLSNHCQYPLLWQGGVVVKIVSDNTGQISALGIVHDNVQLVLRLERFKDPDDMRVI